MFSLNRNIFLNFLRWTSALIVVMGHLRSILFVDYSEIRNPNFLHKFFYFITSLGHEAVIIFFVLSGYLVGGGVIKQCRSRLFQPSIFSINRLSRLYAVLPAALLLTVCLDTAGYFINANLYHHTKGISSLGFNIAERLTIPHFLDSFFMIQNIHLPPLGSNGPLWSLSYEFWFYVLAGLAGMTIIYSFSRRTLMGFASGFFLLFICFWLPIVYLQYFIIWIMGALITYAPKRIAFRKTFFILFSFALFGSLFLISLKKLSFFSDYEKDLLIAFFTCLIILCAEASDKIMVDTHHKLASFSFSLYLIHFPLVWFIAISTKTFFQFGIKEQPSTILYLYFFSCVIMSLISANLFAKITEAKTDSYRNYLRRILITKH